MTQWTLRLLDSDSATVAPRDGPGNLKSTRRPRDRDSAGLDCQVDSGSAGRARTATNLKFGNRPGDKNASESMATPKKDRHGVTQQFKIS